VVAVLGLLAVFGSIVAIAFLGNAANDTINDAIDANTDGDGVVPGLLGGECVEFSLAYTTLSFSTFAVGADETAQAELDEAITEMRTLVPDEIEGDFEVVSEAYREAMQIIVDSGGLIGNGTGPSEEQSRRVDEILEAPEVVAAQENINTWLTENCS
jgi:hypothetical protein